ncbi:MAG: tyrosine-type recombinase/integrase [Acetobacteraceae bacterium]|nr:tyrosine-type recombinase/integrase [Acetobacteraceae bacterium]
MPRRAEPLNAAKVKALIVKGEPSRHADGGNLYLVVTGQGHAWWMFRYRVGGKAREMGLGPADHDGRHGHSLADAREKADTQRKLLRDGKDPIGQRDEAKVQAAREEASRRTFRQAAEALIAEKAHEWRNPKHRAQWSATLAAYAYPELGDMRVSAIGLEEVKRVLAPIWTKKPETAVRVRGRVEAVLDFAAVHGWREGANPARWQGNLKFALPSRAKVAPVEHHPALPWQEIGAFMRDLRGQQATSALALEFLILTAARTGEAIGARWSEIDQREAVWAVPRDRMKAGKEHRVPLSDAALQVLRQVAPLRDREAEDPFVFPGLGQGRPLSGEAMRKLLDRMERGAFTPHGFRSTFRDWAGETTAHPRDVVEMALAHTVANKVEAAYRRGDMFQKRRQLMQDWADFCARLPAPVVQLGELRAAAD